MGLTMFQEIGKRLEDLKDRLEGSPKARSKLQRESAFSRYTDAAVADGILTPEELQYLERIRSDLGISKLASDQILRTSIVNYFRDRLTSVEYTTPADAAALIKVITIGLRGLKASWSEVKSRLRPQMLAYLGRVLARQWDDNKMDDEEVAAFKNICQKFGLPFAEVARHFSGEIQQRLEAYIEAQYAAGDLSDADANYVGQIGSLFQLAPRIPERLTWEVHRRLALAAVRRGEFLTYRSPIMLDSSERCIFAVQGARFIPKGKGFDKSEVGTFVLSDRKLYFVPNGGGTKTVLLKRIVGIQPGRDGFEVIGNKKSVSGLFLVAEAELAFETLTTAVLIEKRHMLPGDDEERSRNIPQDVKHEVWHRDGGRCVQCGATQHLHFDHVIPFSRGGANIAANIQLLCVSCNLSKGDRI